jgi:hypothetical protein
VPRVGKNVGTGKGQEADGNGKQHEKIRQHEHLASEFLFWALE